MTDPETHLGDIIVIGTVAVASSTQPGGGGGGPGDHGGPQQNEVDRTRSGRVI